MEGDLKGIGCCPGRVKGKVRVILNPDEISSLEGDILSNFQHRSRLGYLISKRFGNHC